MKSKEKYETDNLQMQQREYIDQFYFTIICNFDRNASIRENLT